MATSDTVAISYTDAELRNLVEEFIAQQRSDFTFKGLCSFILYWAVEDGRIAKEQNSLFEGRELHSGDQDRVRNILDSIALDGRIAMTGEELSFRKALN